MNREKRHDLYILTASHFGDHEDGLSLPAKALFQYFEDATVIDLVAGHPPVAGGQTVLTSGSSKLARKIPIYLTMLLGSSRRVVRHEVSDPKNATIIAYLPLAAVAVPRDLRASTVVVAQDLMWRITAGRAAIESRPLKRQCFRLLSSLWRRWESRIYPSFKAVSVVSDVEAAATDHGAGLIATVVPNGVGLADQARISADPCVIAFVGNYRSPKNVDAATKVLQRCAELRRSGIEAQALLIGGGLPNDVRALARTLEVPLSAPGYVTDLGDSLNGVTLMLLDPPVATGIKNSALSAASHGVPIVCNGETAGGLPQAIRSLCWSFDTEDECNQVIAQILSDYRSAAARALRCRDTVRRDLTWENYANQISQLAEK